MLHGSVMTSCLILASTSHEPHVQDVCDFCNQHLEANKEAFANPKLKLIYDDAKAQLEQHEGTFDVIIADLADPVFGGPCYQARP